MRLNGMWIKAVRDEAEGGDHVMKRTQMCG